MTSGGFLRGLSGQMPLFGSKSASRPGSKRPGRAKCRVFSVRLRPGLGPGIAEGKFISKSYQKALKSYQMKACAVPAPCRGFKKLKNTRVWTGPPRKRQHYRGFRHGPRQMPRGGATFFSDVLGLRAVGVSFVASARVCVVFWGSFFEIPNTIEKVKPRIAESAHFVGGLAVPSPEFATLSRK